MTSAQEEFRRPSGLTERQIDEHATAVGAFEDAARLVHEARSVYLGAVRREKVSLYSDRASTSELKNLTNERELAEQELIEAKVRAAALGEPLGLHLGHTEEQHPAEQIDVGDIPSPPVATNTDTSQRMAHIRARLAEDAELSKQRRSSEIAEARADRLSVGEMRIRELHAVAAKKARQDEELADALRKRASARAAEAERLANDSLQRECDEQTTVSEQLKGNRFAGMPALEISEELRVLVDALPPLIAEAKAARVYPAPSPQPYGVSHRGAEYYARDWLRHLGLGAAEVTRATADGGVDVDSLTHVAQVKNYSGSVGVEAVREIFGVAAARRKSALLLTSGTFTKEALTFANSVSIPLLNYDALAGTLVGLNESGEHFAEHGIARPKRPSAESSALETHRRRFTEQIQHLVKAAAAGQKYRETRTAYLKETRPRRQSDVSFGRYEHTLDLARRVAMSGVQFFADELDAGDLHEKSLQFAIDAVAAIEDGRTAIFESIQADAGIR